MSTSRDIQILAEAIESLTRLIDNLEGERFWPATTQQVRDSLAQIGTEFCSNCSGIDPSSCMFCGPRE